MEKIQRIAIFGAGTMGLGIAQTALQSGFEVQLYDVFSEMARKKRFNSQPFELIYREIVEDYKTKLWLALFLAKGLDGKRIYQSREAVDNILNRVQFLDSSNLESLAFADFVIEAIFENPEAKKELYRTITEKVGPDIPIASNTSTIRIESLAQAVKNPGKFLGMHFFNPVPRMQLVELIFSKRTNSETVAWATYLAAALGKTYVIAPDIPGFIVNRVALPMVAATFEVLDNGAIKEKIDGSFLGGEWYKYPPALVIMKAMAKSISNLMKETDCSLETIDKAFKFGLNWPIKASELDWLLSLPAEKLDEQKDRLKFRMGPVMFCDLVGNDVSLDALKSLQQQESEKHHFIPLLLEKMVVEKKFGMKTGEGFYKHGPKVKLNNLGDGYWQIIFGDGKGNLLSSSIVRKLRETFESMESQENIKMVFIGANGPVNGANIKEFPLCLQSIEQAQKAVGEFNDLLKTIEDFPAPVIALIRKRALGGGYELALACDWIVAEKGSMVGLPEVTLGIMPGAGGTQRLPRRAGKSLAANLILSGNPREACKPLADLILSEDQMEPEFLKPIFEQLNRFISYKFESGRQAKKMPLKEGLRNKLKARKEMKKIQLDWKMAGYTTPKSFAFAWQAIINGNRKNLDEGLADERNAILEVFKTRDAEEGIRAFLEKRKPEFREQ
ncbi:MAG: enoyl-CoA hydratase/isomerase family protein [Candidatus Yanofskybacteria bacterium]|nr:enoyl-CoA hydratase/isomerase family protein [Candidatus Yanofskybacteria bacterium]